MAIRCPGEPMANQHIGGAGPLGGRKLLSAMGEMPLSEWEQELYSNSPESQKHEVRKRLPNNKQTKMASPKHQESVR